MAALLSDGNYATNGAVNELTLLDGETHLAYCFTREYQCYLDFFSTTFQEPHTCAITEPIAVFGDCELRRLHVSHIIQRM